MKNTLTLTLPTEFLEMCTMHNVEPDAVLRGFIADLCHIRRRNDGYMTNGSDEREYAEQYYQRCGWAWINRQHIDD